MQMLKFNNVLEHKIEDRLYKFMCAHDSPIGEIYDSLSRMISFVAQQIAAAEKAKEEEKEKKACAESACCKDNPKPEDAQA